MVNRHDWPERSIGYLSRMYNNLQKGNQYIDTKPAIHIGILNFSPFEEQPIFYSRNLLMDVIHHRIYSSKFAVNVLDLSHIELATQEDKNWNLDFWARLKIIYKRQGGFYVENVMLRYNWLLIGQYIICQGIREAFS